MKKERRYPERRGIPPKDLTQRWVAPPELTRPLVDLGPHAPWSDVHDRYWKWCEAEQKQRREIFLLYMGAIDAEKASPRVARYKGKDFIRYAEGPLGLPRKTDPRFGLEVPSLVEPSHKWPKIAWELAETIFVGLTLPHPFKTGPHDRKNALLLAVAREHEKVAPKQIRNAEAIRSAGKGANRSSIFEAKKQVPKDAQPWWKWVIDNIES
jgi:hypothetical protein